MGQVHPAPINHDLDLDSKEMMILKNHMVRVGRGAVPSMWEMLFPKDREVYQVDTRTEGTYCFLKGPMLPMGDTGQT